MVWGYQSILSFKICSWKWITLICFIVHLLLKCYKINYKTYKFYQFFWIEFLRAKCLDILGTKCFHTPKLYTANVNLDSCVLLMPILPFLFNFIEKRCWLLFNWKGFRMQNVLCLCQKIILWQTLHCDSKRWERL